MWAAMIPAAMSAFGGVVSANIQAGEFEKARKLLAEAAAKYGALALPDLKRFAAEIDAVQYPERSAMEDIAPEDAGLAGHQVAAIDQAAEASRPGMTGAEADSFSAALGEIARRNRAGREAIETQTRSSGGLTSGQGLGMALQAQSANADQQNRAMTDATAQAQARALGAMRERYSMARARSGDQYGRQRDLAQATDSLRDANARFSLNKIGQKANLENQDFDNRYRKTAGEAGQALPAANLGIQAGQQQGQAWAGGMSAAGRSAYSWLDDAADEKTNSSGGRWTI